MRKFTQRILRTMMMSRKVKLTPANENSSVLPFTDRTLTTLVIISTKGGSTICVYTLVINVRGGASYFDILYHLSFIYIHKISILEVFIVGIAVDENYVRKQKAPLFTIYTHFQRCLLMKRICQITTATSFYNIYTFSEVLAVELLFVRTQK